MFHLRRVLQKIPIQAADQIPQIFSQTIIWVGCLGFAFLSIRASHNASKGFTIQVSFSIPANRFWRDMLRGHTPLFNWPVKESLLDGNKKNKKIICAVTIPFQKHINCVHVRETLCNVLFFFSLPRVIRFYFQMLYLSKYTQQPPQSSFCIQLKSKLLCHKLLLACKLNIVSVIISLL